MDRYILLVVPCMDAEIQDYLSRTTGYIYDSLSLLNRGRVLENYIAWLTDWLIDQIERYNVVRKQADLT